MSERKSTRTWLTLIVGFGAAIVMMLLVPVLRTSANEDQKRKSPAVKDKDDAVKDGLPLPGEREKTWGAARVAVLNLQKVATEYHRTTELKKQIEQEAKDCDDAIKQIQKDIKKYEEVPDDTEEHDKAVLEIRKLKRLGQEKVEERNEKLARKFAEGEKAIYKDIEAVVGEVARKRGIDLVVSYNDVPDEELKYSPQVLQKRIGTSGMPIYAGPDVDISNVVIHVLNWGQANCQPERPQGAEENNTDK
jgi:Skp family chaperone for outer membrane proteins